MHEEISEDRREAEARILEDPLAYTCFNGPQLRFIENVRGGDGVDIVIAIMGNGTGKSFSLVSIWSAIMFATVNPYFNRAPFGPDRWPYSKDLRLITTTPSLEDTGPIQKAMAELFPAGQWGQSRGVGKGYYSQGWTNSGFAWDAMNYNQAVTEFASHTKGAILLSEPPRYAIFSESVSRLRGGGLVIMEMTPLSYAAWVKDELIDPGALILDGVKVGDVRVSYGEIHENCRDCHPNGQLPHKAIYAIMAAWPEEEREARKSGGFMHLAGRIYKKWGDANELAELPDYHAECWEKGRFKLACVMDPHDRKPFALGWKAIFPNEDVVTVAEWPGFLMHKASGSPIEDPEDYRALIHATEAELGRVADHRLVDPNFGNAPKLGGATIKEIFAGPCRDCKKAGRGETCAHRLFFHDAPNSIEDGHIIVRTAIGDPENGVRPKLYALREECPNTCFGMRHYGYRENKDPQKGLSEVPELVYKDFPDLDRYLFLAGLVKWQEPLKPQDLWRPKIRGRRVSAT